MFDKLKREWKTFALSVSAIALGAWEGAREMGYDLTPIIPEKYRPFAVPGLGIAFLILRQWRELTLSSTTTTVTKKTEIETKDQ